MIADPVEDELAITGGPEEDALAAQVATREEQQTHRAADEQHFEKLFTDQEYLNQIAKNPLIAEAEKRALRPGEIRIGAANRSYLDFVAGRELSEVEYKAVRDAYADKTFGKPKVTDTEFFGLVKGQYETQQKRRAAAEELYTDTVKKALDDELKGTSSGSVELFQKWREKNKEVVTADEELGFELKAFAIMRQAKEDIRAVAPQAARVWQSLSRYNEGEASEQDIQDIGAELVAMPRPERKRAIAYGALAAKKMTGDTNPLLQVAMNLEKSIQSGFGFMESPFTLTNVGGALPMSIPTLSYRPLADIEAEAHTTMMRLSRDDSTRTSPAKQAEFARAQQALEMTNVVRDLREAAKLTDPVKALYPEGTLAGTVERGIYGAAGSIGYMAATALSPLLGLYAISGQEYDDMRRENPDMNPHAAAAASLVSGAIQTLVEMMEIRTYGGIGAALMNSKSGIISTAAKLATGLAKENAQEAIQDATSAGIPLIMSHLRSDMPDQNTYKIMKSYFGQRGEVFFSTLALVPFGIVGSNYSPNDQTLSYLGFNAAQRKEILESVDQKAAFKAEIPKRSQTSIDKGIKLLTADMAAAKAIQENADMPTLESGILPDGAREYRVVRNPPAAATGPQYLMPAEMGDKTVTLSTTDPATNSVAEVTVPAAQAQSLVKRNIDAYSALIDCLIK